ncbi:MAG: hypothetical protein HC890_16915 [Chloroflexaceae bacterium]|nr:hypothetical protein [Chloroflexaceae bacterium]
MPKPNFKQGKPVAKLLISAILAHFTDEIPDISGKSRIRPERSPQGQPLLRVKADIGVLRTLVTTYGRSQICRGGEQDWLAGFLEATEEEQLKALKNALTCLLSRGLIEDQREKGCNTPARHF